MRRHSKAFILLLAAILILLSISKVNIDKWRGYLVALVGSHWNAMPTSSAAQQQVVIERLQLENQQLRAELQRVLEQFGHGLNQMLDVKVSVTPAKVIFRSPALWDSSLWINVGKINNTQNDKEIIAKNSPVVVGGAVVGIIDYVGEKQSRVRLITDTGLTPSVRAVRTLGKGKYKLAKGELYGCCKPAWRREEYVLRGVGFNCDFADGEGPARDLRAGVPVGDSKGAAMAIVKVGDLLITTGLDGVFPPGLHVGRVTKIFPLKEGDYYYELEAEPAVRDLDSLAVVFILPPVGFDAEDLPPALGQVD